MDEVIWCDPSRSSIVEATGPISVTKLSDRIIITFTQLSPKVDGISSGASNSELEMIVIARLAFSRSSFQAMLNTLAEFSLAKTPAAGCG